MRVRCVWLLSAVAVLGALGCDCGGRTSQTRAYIEVDPSVLDFGAQEVGVEKSLELVVRNTGRAELQVSGWEVVDDDGAAFSTTPTHPARLPSGASTSLTVTFRGQLSPSLSTARLRLDSDAENAPTLFVSLLGKTERSDAGTNPPDAGDSGMPVADGGVDGGPDSGMPEVDAGLPDAGPGDAGLDSGVPDAGVADAGTPDAGVSDAGGPVDSGAADAGSADAGSDGGSQLPSDGGGFQCLFRLGGTGADYGIDVAQDQAGNLLYTGYFQNTVTVGGSNLSSLGGRDVVIGKIAANCQPVWTLSLGGAAGNDYGEGVAADLANNVYVTGEFQGTLQVPGAGALVSAGSDDIFLVSLDPAGTHRWSRRSGAAGTDVASSVATSVDGGVLVTGSVSSSVDFGGGALRHDGGMDLFVANFSAATGQHEWSRMFGGRALDQGMRLACRPDGYPTVVGSFLSSSIDFGDGPLVGTGASVGFVTELGAGGLAHWSRSVAASGAMAYVDLIATAVATSGETVVAGAFEDTVAFGGSVLNSVAPGYDGFLARFSATGQPLWARGYGGNVGPDAVARVALADDGSIVVTGVYRGSIDFGGGPLVSAGAQEIFVARLSSTGQHIWSRRFGGTLYDQGAGVAVDSTRGLVFVTGQFEGTVDFGSGPVVSAGGGDLFVLVLGL